MEQQQPESLKDVMTRVLQPMSIESPGPAVLLPLAQDQQTDPECPECSGQGWLKGDAGVTACACSLSVYLAKRRAALLAWGHLSSPLAVRTFDALQESPLWTPAQLAGWRTAVEQVRAFARGEAPFKWLVLIGARGGGKTHMALAVLNWRIEHTEAGPPGKYVVVPDYLGDLKGRFDRPELGGAEELHQQYVDVPLLVLDDLGAEHMTGWAQEQVYRLLDARYREERQTVIASNMRAEAIPVRLADRLMDARLCRVVVLDVPSFRSGRIW